MSTPGQDPRFAVLVPVKPPAVAKSRLSELGDDVRRELVVAFAADTLTAALASPLVDQALVVTDDAELAQDLVRLGARAVPDAAGGDLNESLVQAAEEANRRWPRLAVASLCADLPALRSEQLSTALARASCDRASFVSDAQNAGTTFLAAPSRRLFTPRFGPASRKAHLDAGVSELELDDVPGLRRDVDTPADLRDAVALGVGERTARVAAGLRL